MENQHASEVKNSSLTIAMMIGLMAPVAVAKAQTRIQAQLEERLTAAVNKLEMECNDDLKKYCNTVTPGEGRLLLCLEAHEDKISTRCDYSLFSAARNLHGALDRIEQAADACWNDIEKHCAHVPEGGGHIVQCLIDQKSSLEPACGSKINDLFPLGK